MNETSDLKSLRASKDILEDLQRILTRNRNLFSPDLIKAVGDGIICVERSIPQKPSIPRPVNLSLLFGYCPGCGQRQSGGSLRWHNAFNKRCNECGQLLDWSSIDED